MRVVAHIEPDARRESFVAVHAHEFRIAVKEKAARNAANSRVRELIANHFGVGKSAVRFVTGMRGSRKTFEVIR